MTLKKVFTIDNVYSVEQSKHYIFISKEKNGFDIYDNKSLEITGRELLDDLKVYETSTNNGTTYFMNPWGKLFKMEESKTITFLEEYRCSGLNQADTLISVYYGGFGNKKYKVFDLSRNEFLWSIENIIIEIIKSYCFQRKNGWFAACDIETGTIFWEKQLTNDFPDAKRLQIITVYHNILVIAIGTRDMAGYDVRNGELLWQVNNTNSRNLILDTDEKLKGVTFNSYFEADVITGKYNRVNFAPFEESNKDPNFFDSQGDNFAIVDKYLITTDSDRNRIGGFNLETIQYDWFYTEEAATDFPTSKAMKYFEPYLFVIDNVDTLHVYTISKDQLEDV